MDHPSMILYGHLNLRGKINCNRLKKGVSKIVTKIKGDAKIY